MYKLYDLDMNEIPFPEGVMPLDFLVGAISKTRETEDIPGRHGVMNYGFNYNSRPVTINMLLTANDRIDFQLLRNEIYALFNNHDEFYIADNLLPSRVLKVAVDESYSPEKFNHTDAEVTINCRTLDSLFWESKYTTLELHDSGYSATAEKYGLVDNIDDEKVKYRFTPDLVYTDFTSNLFEQGSMFLSNGQNSDGNTQLGRLKNHYSVIKGQNYQLNLSETGGTINYIRIFHYDSAGNKISDEGTSNVNGNGDTSLPFVALGTSIRLLIYANGSAQVNVGGIGTLTKISLSSFSSKLEFNVYNAGNVTIEPESMMLNIIVNGVKSNNNFTIRNKTTGDTFIMERSSDNFELRIKGMVVSLGGISNIFRNTNRRFIKLVPGDNEFEILNGTFGEISFEFKYMYK